MNKSYRLMYGVGAVFLLSLCAIFVIFYKSGPPARVASPLAVELGEAPAQPLPNSTYRNRALWTDPSAPGKPAAADPNAGKIRGMVYDQDGRTLSGVAVRATTFELAGNVPTLAGAAKSDAAGHFEMKLPEGTYQVDAHMEAGGYGPTSATVRTGETVSLVLPISGVATGHVYDEKHQPMKEFAIEVLSVVPGTMPAPAPLVGRRFSNADGSYKIDQLPSWPVMIKASAEGHAASFSPALTVEAKQTRQVDLTLTPGCALAGTVEEKGAPVPYVLVNAESRVLSGSASEQGMNANTQVQSDTQGRFRLEHVPTGTVLVRAYDGSHAVATQVIEVASCDKVPPVKLQLSYGGSISGRAVTSDGKPVSGARLSVSSRVLGFVATRSGEDGSFRFDRLPAGMVRMELHHEGQRTLVNVPIKDGEEAKQDMVLFARGKGEIRGRITAGRRPLPNMRLLIAAGHGKSGVDTYYTVTKEDGTYSVPSVPEGLYVVQVISTDQGQGVKVPPGGVVTVDLDVTPKPAPPPEPMTDDDEDAPAKKGQAPANMSVAPTGTPVPAGNTPPAPAAPATPSAP